MKIAFLIHNAYGIGGTIRSTVNLSGALAVRHDVEVISVHRVADRPALAFDPRVTLRSLVDMREDSPSYAGDNPLMRQPNTMFPDVGVDGGRLRYTALHDRRIAGHLARTDAHVLIATRPILNGYLARYGPRHALRIGQEHLSLGAHSEQLRTDQNAALAELDAFVTVAEADAGRYREAIVGSGPASSAPSTTVVAIPNAVPAPAVEPSPLDTRTIVAAGRLVAVKRYDRLVDAFAEVSADHPDWTLRIYGRGPEKAALRRRIDGLGLYERALLMGPASPIETEWAKGAIAAVSSDMESFGMTIVEAMHCGVPVIATDCPHGPGEIITHGRDGLLVPLDGGVDAYAEALRTLIGDGELRARLGEVARSSAAAYAPSAVGRRYEQLFHDVARRRYRERTERGAGRSGAATTATGAVGRARGRLRKVLGRRADGGEGGRTPEPWAYSTPEPASDRLRPLAHARVTPDGSLFVRFDAGSLPPGPLDFVARLRRDPEGREVRLPLPLVATARDLTTITTTLARDAHTLAEGRWDCYVTPRGSSRRYRLTAHLTEQARLLTLPPVLDERGLSAWIPYTTTDGYLALRTWLRPAHAEVDGVVVGADAATVTVTLLGSRLPVGPVATAVAVSREDPRHDFTVPAHGVGDRRVRFTVPYGEALSRRATEHDVWDLTLRLSPGHAPLPVGRVLGDRVDRKKTDTYPSVVLPGPDRGSTRVKPYFTSSNDLALSARDGEPKTGRPRPARDGERGESRPRP